MITANPRHRLGHIDAAVGYALALANVGNDTVAMMFNDTPLIAHPGEDSETVSKRYWDRRREFQEMNA